MITYLFRILWALFIQVLYSITFFSVFLYYLLFDLKQIKIEYKNIKCFLFYSITLWDVSDEDYLFVWNERGKWKSIWHWALKIKNKKK